MFLGNFWLRQLMEIISITNTCVINDSYRDAVVDHEKV